jgi:hypothetical protein
MTIRSTSQAVTPAPLTAATKAAKDGSAKQALAALDRNAGTITGAELAKAITTGIADHDRRGATVEYADFARWAHDNARRLTPEARAVMNEYTRVAQAAKRARQHGLTPRQVTHLHAAMKQAAVVRPAEAPTTGSTQAAPTTGNTSATKPTARSRLDRVLAHPNSVFKRQGYSAKYNPRPDELDSRGRLVRSLSNGNCGPTSLAMAVKAFGLEQGRASKNPEDSIDLARNAMTKSSNWNTLKEPSTNDKGTFQWQWERGAKRLGLKEKKLPVSQAHPLKALDAAFKKGHMVMLGGQPGRPGNGNTTAYEQAMRHRSGNSDYLFSTGHAILVMGKDKQGRYLVADPLSRKGVVHMTAKEMASFKQWYGVEVWR